VLLCLGHYPSICHGARKYKDTWDESKKDTEGVEGIVLRKGGDVGRRGGSGEVVAV